jgi:hypothetical protein
MANEQPTGPSEAKNRAPRGAWRPWRVSHGAEGAKGAAWGGAISLEKRAHGGKVTPSVCLACMQFRYKL